MSRERLNKAMRAVLEAVEPIVAAAGGQCRVDKSRQDDGHARLIIEANGQTRFTPLSGSPRTIDQAIKYKTSDVKRLLREMGASHA